MSDRLANAAATLNRQGVTVWIRFAYEMNGSWMAYGLQPDVYVATFRALAQTIQSNSGCTSTL
jgi:beta-mannanase